MFFLKPLCCLFFILFFSIDILLLAQETKVRPEESDIQAEKIFIEACREKILGNSDEAVLKFLEVIKKDNNNAAANYELARIYKKQNLFNKAIQCAERAVELDEFNLFYCDLFAILLEKDGNLKKAADLYTDLIGRYPDKESLYFDCAYFNIKNNKQDQAVKVYNALEKRKGISERTSMRKYKLYMAMGKNKKASQELEKLIKAFPFEADYLIRLANFYAADQNADKAKEYFQKALVLDPDNPAANMAMIEFFLENGDTARYFLALMTVFENPQQNVSSKIKTLEPLIVLLAEGNLNGFEVSILALSEKLIQAHPSNTKANIMYGELLFRNKNYLQALPPFKTALKSVKNNLQLWKRVLYCLMYINNKDELKKMSAEMLELYPGQAASFFFHGVALFYHNDFVNSEKELKLALDFAFNDEEIQAQSWRFLGRLYHNSNSFEKSKKAFEQSVVILPENIEISYDYAKCLINSGADLDKAATLIKKVLNIYPANLKFRTINGFLLYKQAKYNLADKELDFAINAGGAENPEALEKYGDVQFKLDNIDKAVLFWQKAKENGSSSSLLERKISTKQLYE